MNKILILSGPTATGKTATAIRLAQEFDGELISADSRQVYKGMDIVTGKDIKNSKFEIRNLKITGNSLKKSGSSRKVAIYCINGIGIWGLDLVRPDQSFDISQFVVFAREVIEDIRSRGKLPIIVGGTGFWIRSLVNPPATVGIPVDNKLRRELEPLSVEKLQERLEGLDPEKLKTMNDSDRNNPRRLVRAIEIATYEAGSMNHGKNKQDTISKIPYTLLWLGLRLDTDTLVKKITDRVRERVQQGAENEVRQLVTRGYSWKLPSMSAIGYRDWRPYLEGTQSLDDTLRLWTLHEVQYARRQMTWFQKEQGIVWFDVSKPDSFATIKLQVQKWLKNS